MKISQITLIIFTLASGIGMAAVRLGYITDLLITDVIFIVFVISLLGDAILGIYNLRKNPWKDFSGNTENSHEVITKALDLACLSIGNGQYHLRSNVFLKCPRDKNKICIKYHSTSMMGANDANIKLERWQGCSGQAWGYSAPIVADLTVPSYEGGSNWGLTKEHIEITDKLVSILSLPVRHPEDKNKTIAILSFDSEDPIANIFIKDEVKDVAIQVATQIGLLLFAFGQADPI